MLLLVLEDELDQNRAGREREQRVRRELEAYARLILPPRRLEEFDRQGAEICQTVTLHSRFSRAALLLERSGQYQLAGASGLDAATAAALGEMVGRIPPRAFSRRALRPWR